MAGLYIHIPFCKQLCYYCDFYFSVSLERKAEMLQVLKQELVDRSVESTTQNPVKTIYIGGGTPSVYTPEELGQLVATIKKYYKVNDIEEFTVEVNPDDIDAVYLEGLLKFGVTRLSIGVQSFIDRDLVWMNRRHSAKQAYSSILLAQKAGFNQISADLIYGIPGMAHEEWTYNVNKMLSCGVGHISAYHLGIEEKTVFGRRLQKGLLQPVAEERSEEQFETLRKMLLTAGFEHYEVSNFAQKGCYGIHNSNYWKQQPYIGIGPSAHSYDGFSFRRWNISNNRKYLECFLSPSDKLYYEHEILSEQMRYNEYLLTSLRTKWGVDLYYLESNFSDFYTQYLIDKSAHFISKGHLVLSQGKLTIPPACFLLSDYIISSLFYS